MSGTFFSWVTFLATEWENMYCTEFSNMSTAMSTSQGLCDCSEPRPLHFPSDQIFIFGSRFTSLRKWQTKACFYGPSKMKEKWGCIVPLSHYPALVHRLNDHLFHVGLNKSLNAFHINATKSTSFLSGCSWMHLDRMTTIWTLFCQHCSCFIVAVFYFIHLLIK